ncbi:MAG: hypothetical protein AABW56_01045 [Nanoarchaeota archaeon]
MAKGDINTNSLVIVSLIFILVAFLTINPFDMTGLITLPIIGDTSEIPNATLMGGIVLLIIIWIIIMIIAKKVKKKSQLEKIPVLTEVPSPVSNINFKNPQELKKDGLTEEELKQLFNDISPRVELAQRPIVNKNELDELEKQITNNLGFKKLPEINKEPHKKDLNELKKLMLALLKKNYTKESVIKYLKKKGWSLSEISQVNKEINMINLRNYVKEAISLGHKKPRIVKELQNKDWTIEEINRAMQ